MVTSLATKALVGALYEKKGAIETRKFIEAHFLSRQLEARDHLHYLVKNPRQLLLKVCESLGRKRPIARLLKESGRTTNHSVFVVGLFIESEKVSEGYGDSLAMAEIRATKRALEDHFLQQVQDLNLSFDGLDEGKDVSFLQTEKAV